MMDDLGYETGRNAGRHWMTEILKTHDQHAARELYNARMQERSGTRGLSTFETGFFAGAEEVLNGQG